MVAQGNALGFGINWSPCKGEGILRPFRAEEVPRTRSRGDAPGWHAPRRWRVNVAEFSIGETCYGPIYETGSSTLSSQLPAMHNRAESAYTVASPLRASRPRNFVRSHP